MNSSRINRNWQRAFLAVMVGRALSWAYLAVLRSVLKRNTRRFMAGDVEPLLRGYAENASLILDGTHSWSGRHSGKPAIRAFFERFLAERIRGQLHEILIAGPPWRTLITAHFTDQATDTAGRIVYRNDAVFLVEVRWAKIVRQQIFEDTQRVAQFDEHQAEGVVSHLD